MKRQNLNFRGIPALLWGCDSSSVYLYIHGQAGCKEEAETFASLACRYGWQVLSIDLPGHGERKGEANSFDPWHVAPELSRVLEYVKKRWTQISLFANSIGAWFSMLSFANEQLEKCLFVSPILDMQELIGKMMLWANVSEERLKREQTVPTSFGQTLSWEYWVYAQKHPITRWVVPTKILYGERDPLTDRCLAETFAQRFHCDLTIVQEGEHWFHTPEQLETRKVWVESSFLTGA